MIAAWTVVYGAVVLMVWLLAGFAAAVLFVAGVVVAAALAYGLDHLLRERTP